MWAQIARPMSGSPCSCQKDTCRNNPDFGTIASPKFAPLEICLSSLFAIRRDAVTDEEYLETALSGHALLEHPMLNKGSAFTESERREFGLLGLLPMNVSAPVTQIERIYGNYKSKTTDLERYIHLISLQDRNETAFYKLISDHLPELMPIIYTPVVGEACQNYSKIYHRPRGLYVSYPQRNDLDSILANVSDAIVSGIEVIVVTDGERILGLGDLGVGGMGIPVGKLALYTVCAGIHPAATLPVILDVGTNNKALLDDPLYVGWRHERVRGADYDAFVDAFIAAVKKRFPKVLLQWEDFAKNNATKLLERYRDQLCSFNDDIQGTGAVAVSVALAAVAVTGSRISEQRIVLLGAGSAAAGISSQLVAAMMLEGLTEAQAKNQIYLVDSQGLVHDARKELEPFKQAYARSRASLSSDHISLLETVKLARPTILIGIAAQANAFDEAVVREMAAHTARPIILPLSNPTSKCEALPTDLIRWTEGRALVATGSPFADVEYNGKYYKIAQCNNAYIFPGVGLGVIAAEATRVTDTMFVAAARALSELSPVHGDLTAPLLPALKQVRSVSRHVAIAVAEDAMRCGVAAKLSRTELEQRIDAKMWTPKYLPYRRLRN
jgi:malate dehydrogenase (oxaloacetate-decarboxylating)